MIPGVKKSGLAYVHMENISKFINTLERFGVPKAELFTTVDLYEEKDLQTVALSLYHLSLRWPSLAPSVEA
jgi:transgelin